MQWTYIQWAALMAASRVPVTIKSTDKYGMARIYPVPVAHLRQLQAEAYAAAERKAFLSVFGEQMALPL